MRYSHYNPRSESGKGRRLAKIAACLVFAFSILPLSMRDVARAQVDPMAPPPAPAGVQWHVKRFDLPVPQEICKAFYQAHPELSGKPCTEPVAFGYTDAYSLPPNGAPPLVRHLSLDVVGRIVAHAQGPRFPGHRQLSPMCVPDPSGYCTNPLYVSTYATACAPNYGCSGQSGSWQVYDSEQFGYDYTDVWDAGQYHNSSGPVTITWTGCSPTWSTNDMGCGSNWWFIGVGDTTYCESERMYGYPNGNTSNAYYGPTYTPNPSNC